MVWVRGSSRGRLPLPGPLPAAVAPQAPQRTLVLQARAGPAAALQARGSPEQVQQLHARVAALQAQNGELAAELAAFEPEFFEEIEDLKNAHHQLSLKCEQQEQTIQRLRAGGG